MRRFTGKDTSACTEYVLRINIDYEMRNHWGIEDVNHKFGMLTIKLYYFIA